MKKLKELPLVTYSYNVKIFSIILLIFSIIGFVFIKQINIDIVMWLISISLFLILQSKEKKETEKIIKLRAHAIQYIYKYLISVLLALQLTKIWSGIEFNIIFIVLISLSIQLGYFYSLIIFTDEDCKFIHLPITKYLKKYYYFLILFLLPFLILLIIYLITKKSP